MDMAEQKPPHPETAALKPHAQTHLCQPLVATCPLYLGLIAAQAVYVYHFWVELVHLLEAVIWQPNCTPSFDPRHRLQS
jgi:hypothetical protein